MKYESHHVHILASWSFPLSLKLKKKKVCKLYCCMYVCEQQCRWFTGNNLSFFTDYLTISQLCGGFQITNFFFFPIFLGYLLVSSALCFLSGIYLYRYWIFWKWSLLLVLLFFLLIFSLFVQNLSAVNLINLFSFQMYQNCKSLFYLTTLLYVLN